ncbi:hypothetical protein BBM34_12160 [Vibrio parahaemolyticus]|nr:hypothetical protein [Vibrio parahaemolyticus]KGK08525.1 hypothetical protein EA24_02505 [Vibrio navarrensis]ODZ10858.1 hypothetical protein BBM34_12160 [Vibrio parahaemolyticus]OXD02030.1 hypothetical protein CA166_23565 [Vibrio parahaemolyticus]TOE88963.1 hypothetical protein CGJ32_24195 [Vibrio parahaemolyticus]
MWQEKILDITQFESELEVALDSLQFDEWSICKLREQFVESIVSTVDSFRLVDEVLEVALRQSDSYAKSSCLAIAYDLSLKSQTTELSNSRQALLLKIKRTAEETIKIELNLLLKYYRLELAT